MTDDTWFVYLLECSDNTLYCGITNNLTRRVNQHNKGKGAKYTKGRAPVTLIKFFVCASKSEALKLEYKIKQMSREEKLCL
jgi:putative endonuclease